MLARFYDVVQDKKGNGISGATVTVTRWNGDNATLYTTRAGTTTTSHVLTTDTKGQFSFYAPDGMYSITVEKAGVLEAVTRDDVCVGGGRYLNPEWFGIFEGADGTDITTGLQDWVYELIEHTTGTPASGQVRSGQIVLPFGDFVVGSVLWHPSISLYGSNRAGTKLTCQANAAAIGAASVRAMFYIMARTQSVDASGAWNPVFQDLRIQGNKGNQSNNVVHGIYCENGNLDPDYDDYAPSGDAKSYSAFTGINLECATFSGTGFEIRADRQRLMLYGRTRSINHGIMDGSTVVTAADGVKTLGNDPVIDDCGFGGNTGHSVTVSGCSGLLLVGSNVWGPTPLARSNNALALHMQNVNGFAIGDNVFNDTVSFYGGETNEDRGFSFVGNHLKPLKSVFSADATPYGTGDGYTNAFIRVRGYKNAVIGLNDYSAASDGKRFAYLASFSDEAVGYIEFSASTATSPAVKPWATTDPVPLLIQAGGTPSTCCYQIHEPNVNLHRFSGSLAVGAGDGSAIPDGYALYVAGEPAYFGQPVVLNRPTRLVWSETVASEGALNGGSTTLANKCMETHFTNAGSIATFTVTLPEIPEDGARYAIGTRGGIAALTLTPNTGQTLICPGSYSLAAGGTAAWRYKGSDATWWASA